MIFPAKLIGNSLILGIAVALSLPLAAQDDLPQGKGKEILENTCGECHGLDKVLSQFRSRERWRAIAVAMKSKGATMSDSELNALVDYLFENFGTEPVPEAKSKAEERENINVNKAVAKELVTALQLTPDEAAAIIHFREAHGPFKQWRDLTKVDGVDKTKIEANKDRLTF
jgi:competence ComEA-like helix-hairpin-helix protein